MGQGGNASECALGEFLAQARGKTVKIFPCDQGSYLPKYRLEGNRR